MQLRLLAKILSAARLFKTLYGRYKIQIVVLVIFGFTSGLLESIGVSLLIPLFSFLSNGALPLGSGRLMGMVSAVFSYLSVSFNAWTLLSLMAFLFLLKAVILFTFGYVKVRISGDYEERTRRELYQKTFGARWNYLMHQKTGHLPHIIMSNVSSSARLLESIVAFILDTSSLLAYTVAAVSLSPLMTIGTFAIGGALFIIYKPFVFYRTRQYAQKAEIVSKALAHRLIESTVGLKTIKAMRLEELVVAASTEFFSALRALKIKQYMAKQLMTASIQPISVIFILAMFGIASMRPGFSPAVFVASVYLIMRIFSEVDKAQNGLNAINSVLPLARGVVTYGDELHRNVETSPGAADFYFNNAIEFRHVDFSYRTERKILDDISFRAGKGEIVGIVGPSGAGKTTIVDLLLRLFSPLGGSVYLDERDISSIALDQWRANVGYMAQEVFLKNDTIAQNIRFYRDDVTSQEIEKAAEHAHLLGVIRRLPKGFDTVVGERGILLSVGERQRIALARVLVRRPEILILDEATSALDNESETMIKKSIDSLRGITTVIMIAHRLSTVLDADRVIVIDNGRVVEEGAPRELLENPSTYFHRTYHAGEKES